MPKGGRGAVEVFGELADPAGEAPMRAKVGATMERRVIGPLSAFTTGWAEKDLSGGAWGWGTLGGIRFRW